MGVLDYLFLDWLMSGAQRPERAHLLLWLASAAFGLLLNLMLVAQNGLAGLAHWPEGSFYVLMFGTLMAIPGLAFGVLHHLRKTANRRVAVACLTASSGALLISLWLWTR